MTLLNQPDTESWFDQRPSYSATVPPLLVVKAEKVMMHYEAAKDEVWERAERQQINPWDELISIPNTRAIDAYEAIRQKENGAIHCECAPDESHTCQLCKYEAWVRYQYQNLFEEE